MAIQWQSNCNPMTIQWQSNCNPMAIQWQFKLQSKTCCNILICSNLLVSHLGRLLDLQLKLLLLPLQLPVTFTLQSFSHRLFSDLIWQFWVIFNLAIFKLAIFNFTILHFSNFLTFGPSQHPWSPCAGTCRLLSAGLRTKTMN